MTLNAVSLSFAAALLLFSCATGATNGEAGAPPPGTPEGVAPGMMPSGGSVMPGGGLPQPADTSWVQTKYIDLAYATKSPTEKLDLYLPNDGSGPFPLIVEFHPGGFMIGQKSMDIGPMLKAVKRGYALASVNYRLSGEASFPAAVNDAKTAVKFLRANAATYHLNPDKFAVWGSSAGGNLASMLATSAGNPVLVDPSLGNADVPDAIAAGVDWFGPLYFSAMDAQFKALGVSGVMGPTDAPDSAESKYLGKTVGTAAAQTLVEQASPYTYISATCAPMYIQHGTADRNVPLTQSRIFAEKLAAAIGSDKVVFETIEGAGHGGPAFETDENVKKIIDFLDRYLK